MDQYGGLRTPSLFLYEIIAVDSMKIIGRFTIVSIFTGRPTLSIGEMDIVLAGGNGEIFRIRWTQLERIEMDRKGPFKLIRFKCFDRTEMVSTGLFKRKDLKIAYIRLVELAQLNGIKVMEVRGW